MFCVHCGARLDETARFCSQCGASIDSIVNAQPLSGAESPLNAPNDNPYASYDNYDHSSNYDRSSYDPASTPIDDRLLWNILATLFCCMPCGIAGIIYSSLCISAKGRGDFQSAYRYAKTAQILFWVSFGLGLFGVFAYVCVLSLGSVVDAI